jgi:hypothetical protein
MLNVIVATMIASGVGWEGRWNAYFDADVQYCALQDFISRESSLDPRVATVFPVMLTFVVTASDARGAALGFGQDPGEVLLVLRFHHEEDDPSDSVDSIRIDDVRVAAGQRVPNSNGTYFIVHAPDSVHLLERLKRAERIEIVANLRSGVSLAIPMEHESLQRFKIGAAMFTACGAAIGA